MAAIVLCAVVLGVHLDTEFTGGAMITLSYENSFEMSAVQKTASEALGSNGRDPCRPARTSRQGSRP